MSAEIRPARLSSELAPAYALPDAFVCDDGSVVRDAATWKLETAGGRGAFREIVERLLRERGDWDAIIREFSIGKPEAASI